MTGVAGDGAIPNGRSPTTFGQDSTAVCSLIANKETAFNKRRPAGNVQTADKPTEIRDASITDEVAVNKAHVASSDVSRSGAVEVPIRDIVLESAPREVRRVAKMDVDGADDSSVAEEKHICAKQVCIEARRQGSTTGPTSM